MEIRKLRTVKLLPLVPLLKLKAGYSRNSCADAYSNKQRSFIMVSMRK